MCNGRFLEIHKNEQTVDVPCDIIKLKHGTEEETWKLEESLKEEEIKFQNRETVCLQYLLPLFKTEYYKFNLL